MVKRNFCLMTDSYKFTHPPQYPPGTEIVHSYLESRGGTIADETIFCFLQYYLMEYLEGVVVTAEMVEEAADFVEKHMGPALFNYNGWMHIVNHHGGKLPVEIKAVAEGTRVNVSNALITIVNTDPKCYWLPNFLETLLLKVWYPITVATLSRKIKELILEYLVKTGDPSLIPFKLHDFGYRGVSSEESASIGGAAHLLNFKGTDTVAGIRMLQHYYDAKVMPGFSIPAAEHSTITSWGQEHEEEAYANMLNTYPTGLVAVVSDSWDIFSACRNIWGDKLKKQIEERDGTLVIRPDSGDPATTVLEVMKILAEKFGYLYNSKGYRVLPPYIRVIQGDGVNYHSIREILRKLEVNSYSADNIGFGMGGALLQSLNRDTFNFAFKASAIKIHGVWHDVFKTPITDTGKNSKKGVLALGYLNKPEGSPGRFVTVPTEPDGIFYGNRLRTVFKNGEITQRFTLDDVIANVNSSSYERIVQMGSFKDFAENNL